MPEAPPGGFPAGVPPGPAPGPAPAGPRAPVPAVDDPDDLVRGSVAYDAVRADRRNPRPAPVSVIPPPPELIQAFTQPAPGDAPPAGETSEAALKPARAAVAPARLAAASRGAARGLVSPWLLVGLLPVGVLLASAGYALWWRRTCRERR